MGWLRKLPQCRCQGAMVNVTVDLDLEEISAGPHYLLWSGPGLGAVTSKGSDPSGTCVIPEAVFKRGAVIKLELLPACPADRVVLEWTHMPVLGEAFFAACMREGQPALVPLVGVEALRGVQDTRGPLRTTSWWESNLTQLAG